MDTLTAAERSALMARVRSKNTKPELIVRRILSGLRVRYRLHCKGIPGRPDMANASRKFAVFVHGCFWHAHGCRIGRPPKSNVDFWLAKLERNRQRDKWAVTSLRRQGWRVIVIWQCETRHIPKLEGRMRRIFQAT